MATTYGIISDLHRADIKVALAAMRRLIDDGAKKFILNGDVIGDQGQMPPELYFSLVLNLAGESGLETYVLPGSHEECDLFLGVLEQMKSKYKNLVSVLETPKVEAGDHHLVFLPGSDWRPASVMGGFDLTLNQVHETGLYRDARGAIFYVTEMSDLKGLVTSPEKTVVVSHVPARFSDVRYGSDVAYFGEAVDGAVIPGVILEHDAKKHLGKDASQEQITVFAAKHGYALKRENRGNQDLASILKGCGVTKGITGHFHESAHRAHDWTTKPVPEGSYVSECFWNASYGDGLKFGLLQVDGAKIAYRNIKLK